MLISSIVMPDNAVLRIGLDNTCGIDCARLNCVDTLMSCYVSYSEIQMGGFFCFPGNGEDYMLAETINIKAEVKDRTLFEIEQLSIHQGERIGLVGKNGCGKTTLLEIIAGVRSPDSGSCHVYTSCKLLPQLKSTKSTKSGGEITQAYINHALAQKPELLLADEPTANLDTRHIDKLEQQLKRWQGAFVIVSHDRAFLDALCTSIWEIADEKLSVYQGNYSDYLKQKTIETKEKELAYEKYQSKKKQLEKALQLKEAKAQRATKKPKNVSASEAKITGAKPYFAKKQKNCINPVKQSNQESNSLKKWKSQKHRTYSDGSSQRKYIKGANYHCL